MDVSRFEVPFLMEALGGTLNSRKLETVQDIVLFLRKNLNFDSAKVYQLSYCGPVEDSTTLCTLLISFSEDIGIRTIPAPLSGADFSEVLSPAPEDFISGVILNKTVSGDCYFWCDNNFLLGITEISGHSIKLIFKLHTTATTYNKSNHLYFSALLPLLTCCCFSKITSNIELKVRESEVLEWAMLGKSSAEIAIILSISESTVNFHFNNLYKKLNVTSRTQAVAKAIQYGLISVPSQ